MIYNRLYVVDTENLGSEAFKDTSFLTKKDKIVLFCSKNSKHVDMPSLHMLLSSKATILTELVDVGLKNSLDFQISVFIGMESKVNTYSKVYIVSNDRGFLSSLHYLKQSTGIDGFLVPAIGEHVVNIVEPAEPNKEAKTNVALSNLSNVEKCIIKDFPERKSDQDFLNRVCNCVGMSASKQELNLRLQKEFRDNNLSSKIYHSCLLALIPYKLNKKKKAV